MRKIQLSLFLLLIACMELHATGFGQVRINLQVQEISLKRLLDEVERQTTYRFVYHTGTLPEDKKVSLHVTNASLDEVMSKALAGLPLTYSVKEDNLVIIFSRTPRPPADKIIKGQVTGPDKNPLSGVSVKVTGASTGTITDVAGG